MGAPLKFQAFNPYDEDSRIEESRRDRMNRKAEEREYARRDRAARISYMQDADTAAIEGTSGDNPAIQGSGSWGNFSKGSSTSSKIGGGMQAAGAAYGLFDNAFQDRSVNTIGSPELGEGSLYNSSVYGQNMANANAIQGEGHKAVLGNVAKGAGAGFSAGGPWGALVGAVVGNITGVIGHNKAKKAKREAEARAKDQFNSYTNSFNAQNEANDFEDNNMDRIRALQNNYGIPQSFKSLV